MPTLHNKVADDGSHCPKLQQLVPCDVHQPTVKHLSVDMLMQCCYDWWMGKEAECRF